MQRGQPACLVTPSHLNVVGWRSLRRRPALPRNFRVPPSCAPPQASRPASNLPREPRPGGLRRGRTHPQLWRSRGETVEEPRHPTPAGEGSPTPHWSSLRPMGFSRDVVCPCPPVWMGSMAAGWGGAKKHHHYCSCGLILASSKVPPGRGQLGRQDC